MYKFVFGLGVLGGLVLGYFIGVLTPQEQLPDQVRSLRLDQFAIALPGGSNVTFDIAESPVGHQSVLDGLFSTEDVAVREWLAERDMYSIHDRRLVGALNSRLCKPIPDHATTDEKRRSDELCADNDVVRDINELKRRRERPFHYVGTLIRVGVPEEQPPRGTANVCKESELVGNQIQLTEERRRLNTIEVRATGVYACTGYVRYPDIQINADDARALFDRPPGEYEQAIAVAID